MRFNFLLLWARYSVLMSVKFHQHYLFVSLFAVCFVVVVLVGASQSAYSDVSKIQPWPPVLDKTYPDLELIDQEGQSFRLSDLKGKVILIEPVGMTCPACQGLSGAEKYGAFGNVNPADIYDVDDMMRDYAKVNWPHKDVVLVQLLLYDMRMGPPKAKDAAQWAKHFRKKKSRHEYVVVSPYDLRGSVSYNLVPGFQLIDKDFILRSDSTGHNPKQNMYKTLFPMVPILIAN